MIWNSIVEPDRPQVTIRRMRIACWVIKATYTQSEYVIFIVFPLKQWLHERSSVLRHTYIGCLVSPYVQDLSEVSFSNPNWNCSLMLLSFEMQRCITCSGVSGVAVHRAVSIFRTYLPRDPNLSNTAILLPNYYTNYCTYIKFIKFTH